MISQVTAIQNGANIQALNCPASFAIVHIELQDVNDEKPQFDQVSYRARVREDATGGKSLITITVSGQKLSVVNLWSVLTKEIFS